MQAEQQMLSVKTSLKLLAASALEQTAHIKTLGTFPSNDELALEFDDAFVLVPQLVKDNLLTIEMARKLDDLNEKLNKMSKDKALWLTSSLSEAHEWAEVRTLAAYCLELLKPST